MHKDICLADTTSCDFLFCYSTVPRVCLMGGYVGVCVSTNRGWKHLSRVLSIELIGRQSPKFSWDYIVIRMQVFPAAFKHILNHILSLQFCHISVSGTITFYFALSPEIPANEKRKQVFESFKVHSWPGNRSLRKNFKVHLLCVSKLSQIISFFSG